MSLSVICPVKNEVDFIGYSVMSILPYIDEIHYGLAESDDGTHELLAHIKSTYDKDNKIHLYTDFGAEALLPQVWNFNPMDMVAYNNSFNYLIKEAKTDFVWFLHPDMLVTNPEKISDMKPGPMAFYTHMTSYAGDLQTVITKGRTNKWKNIQARKMGVHYYGGYGSQNEDFYHSEITGKSYKHFGSDFSKYPYRVEDSGINVNHYCEVKSYKRRLEKMKLCLKTLYPEATASAIEKSALEHPRVNLDGSSVNFGKFEFEKRDIELPEIISKYKEEFDSFKKAPVNV